MDCQHLILLAVTFFASAIAVYLPENAILDDQLSEQHVIFDDILRTRQSHRTYTPRKCCKLGMRVAEKGLDCDISYDIIDNRNNNAAYRSQLKSEISAAQVSRRLRYKNLLYGVEKCNPAKRTRSMFEKCCQYQKGLMQDIKDCDRIQIPEERIECRRLALQRGK